MAKRKLTPVPKVRSRRKPADKRTLSESPPAAQSLDHIAPQLRPLAMPIESLDFYPGNPHKHDDEQLTALRASLRQFGQVHALLLNTAKDPPQVVCGNGRLQAALAEGWKMIAAHGRPMTDEEAAALTVLDNQIPELSPGWDHEALKSAMQLAQTSEQELADLLNDLAEAEKLVPEEAVIDSSTQPAVAKSVKKIQCPRCGMEFEGPA